LTSPLHGFDNAILTFKVSDGNYTTNEVGNAIASTKDLVIKALLKEAKNPGTISRYSDEIQKFGGVDGYVFFLEGYLVEPLTYPKEVQFMMECDAEIELSLGSIKSGRFKLLPLIQSPYLIGAEVNIVTPVKGLFRIN
jgi:hypothetical protein